MEYTYKFDLGTPAAVASVAFGATGELAVGSGEWHHNRYEFFLLMLVHAKTTGAYDFILLLQRRSPKPSEDWVKMCPLSAGFK